MSDAFIVRDGKVFLVGDGGDAPVEVLGGISGNDFAVFHAFRDSHRIGGYLRDSKGVWWYHSRDKKARWVTADADGFRVLEDDYGLDGNYVYLEDKIIPDADPRNFRLLDHSPYYATDGRRLYVKTSSHFFHFEDIDCEAVIAKGHFISDRNNLFSLSDSLSLSNQLKRSERVSDNEEYIPLGDWFAIHYPDIIGWWHPDYRFDAKDAQHLSHGWFRTANAVFCTEEFPISYRRNAFFDLVVGADVKSFEPLGKHYARDAHQVFCRSRPVKGADPSTFEPLAEPFGRDASSIYFNGYAVIEADVESFEVLHAERYYGRDKNKVYTFSFVRTSWPFGHPDWQLVELKGADVKSFKMLGDGLWAKDCRWVYRGGEIQKKLDVSSFQLLVDTRDATFASDANGLYRYNGKKVAGVDGSSFRKLNDYWGTDGKVVFFFPSDAIQKTADAASFTVTDDQGGAKDASFQYRVENGRVRKKAL